jgi:hypothetical protein
MGRRTLVIGASGILAPLAAALAEAGDEVTGVARTRSAPSGVATVLVDAASPGALRSALGAGGWDRAVVYAPAVSVESSAVIDALVSGRTVVVRTSSAADPARGPLRIPDETLQLGWTSAPDGGTRWHSPDEVSTAARLVLEDGRGRVLGRVRPWDGRP